jgi:hypothetical protein
MCFGDKLKKPAVDGSTTGLKKFNDAIGFMVAKLQAQRSVFRGNIVDF